MRARKSPSNGRDPLPSASASDRLFNGDVAFDGWLVLESEEATSKLPAKLDMFTINTGNFWGWMN